MSRSYTAAVLAISYALPIDHAAILARLALEADGARLLKSLLSKPGH